jgi:hypothetical protein
MDCHKDVGPGRARKRRLPRPDEAAGLPQLPHRPQGPRRAHRRARHQAFRPRADRLRAAGKHVKTECDKCHEPAKKYSQAPEDCLACHRKDDTHKGCAGPKCADCHTENDWKERSFDHDKTRFALTGKHVDTKCADCHKHARTTRKRRAPASAATARTTTAPRATRAATARSARAATAPRPGSPRPSTTTATPSTRCAASTAARSARLPHRPPVPRQGRHRLHRLPQARTTSTRATTLGTGLRRLPHRARLEGEGQVRPRQDATSRCWASTSDQVRRLPQEHQLPRGARATASAATRRTTSTRPRWAPSLRATATASATGRPGALRPRRHEVQAAQRACREDRASARPATPTSRATATRRRLLQLPQEGRQARGPARHQVRELPRRPRLEDHHASTTATRVSRWSGGTWP